MGPPCVQLTEWVVADLNAEAKLPYPSASFDVVVCTASIDYLTRPLEVMQEVHTHAHAPPAATTTDASNNAMAPTHEHARTREHTLAPHSVGHICRAVHLDRDGAFIGLSKY